MKNIWKSIKEKAKRKNRIIKRQRQLIAILKKDNEDLTRELRSEQSFHKMSRRSYARVEEELKREHEEKMEAQREFQELLEIKRKYIALLTNLKIK